MYKFSEHDKKALYLRRGLETRIISAGEFRQDMFILHRQFLHPHTEQQYLIVVRNMKEGHDMFLVTPLDPLGRFEVQEYMNYVQSELTYYRQKGLLP